MNEFLQKLSKEELTKYIEMLADVEKAQEELLAIQRKTFAIQTELTQANGQQKEINDRLISCVATFNAYVDSLGNKYAEKEEYIKEEKPVKEENGKK